MFKLKKMILLLFMSTLVSSQLLATQHEHHLASYRDPFSVQTRSICVKWVYPWLGSKICVGWKPQAKYLETKVHLIINVPTSLDDIKNRLHQALKTATSAAALAGVTATIATGQISAGIEAAEKTLIPALKISLPASFVLGIKSEQKWTGWQ
jgi:hypothetical protein